MVTVRVVADSKLTRSNRKLNVFASKFHFFLFYAWLLIGCTFLQIGSDIYSYTMGEEKEIDTKDMTAPPVEEVFNFY